MDLEQVVETVEVPRNTGIEGFLQLIRSILTLGRVQEVHIEGNGRVTYKYLAPKPNPAPPLFDPEKLFEEVSPANIIRNSRLVELAIPHDTNAAEQLIRMLRTARLDSVEPIGWVVGADTALGRWLVERSNLQEDIGHPSDTLCGLPVHRDRFVPDESLTLCAGPLRGGNLVDTTHAYKIAMVMQ